MENARNLRGVSREYAGRQEKKIYPEVGGNNQPLDTRRKEMREVLASVLFDDSIVQDVK